MNRWVATGLLAALTAASAIARESALMCSVLNDEVEKIQCKFVTPRKNESREADFIWHSDDFPQDDRERLLPLPANHGSVYDYRFLRGRAQGIWTVTVTLTEADGKQTDTSCRFRLEDDNITVMKP
jgi:hypothetical protein